MFSQFHWWYVPIVLSFPFLLFGLTSFFVLRHAFRNNHHKTMQEGYLMQVKANADAMNAQFQQMMYDARMAQNSSNKDLSETLRVLVQQQEHQGRILEQFMSGKSASGPAYRVGRDRKMSVAEPSNPKNRQTIHRKP